MKFVHSNHYHPKDAKDAWIMFRKFHRDFPDEQFFMVKRSGKKETIWEYNEEVVSDVDSGIL